MKNKEIKVILALLFFIAFASFVSAEGVKYRYTTTVGNLITNDTIPSPSEVKVTLPNTTWNLELTNNDSKFKVDIGSISAAIGTGYPVLNITARLVNLASQNYDGTVKLSGEYIAKYAYAFDIAELTDKTYTVTLDYSGLGVSNAKLFKCGFNFTTNTTNTSTCTMLSASDDGSRISASTVNFSSFFIAQYTAPSVPGSDGPGGGGGGGGGGSIPRIIYVTPTPEGSSIQVYQGDEIIVQYKGGEYHYKVAAVGDLKVGLRDIQSYLPVDIKLGEVKNIGLTSFFAREVELSMHVSNRFAMLTFRSIDKQSFLFPLIPAKPRTTNPTAQNAASATQQVYTPRPAALPTGTTAAGETLQEVQLPESPINMWTVIFAIVFVIFLVGSVALYRTRLQHLEKPPTVTRTGLETAGLPETSSKVSEPAHVLMQEVKPEVKEAAPALKPIVVSHAKKLELEKYIFHALSSGFKEPQVRKALIDKGWPENLVSSVFEEIKTRK